MPYKHLVFSFNKKDIDIDLIKIYTISLYVIDEVEGYIQPSIDPHHLRHYIYLSIYHIYLSIYVYLHAFSF